MISRITCSLKPSLQRGFLKPEAQNIYVRYLVVFTLDKNGEKIETEMKLNIFIFLKLGAMIFPGRFSVNICQ